MSGGIRVTAIYAAHLRDQGHEVSLVSVSPRRHDRVGQLKALVRGRPIPSVRAVTTTSFLDDYDFDWTVLPHQGPVLESEVPDADVIVATWWETAIWISGFGERKGRKSYFMQDYGAPGQTMEQIVPTWKLGIPMITIADWLERLILEHAPESRVVTVPNGVDHSIFRHERGFEGREHVGVVYNQLKSKRIDLASDAVRIAAQRQPGLRLLMTGKPEQAFGDHVQLLGRLSDEGLCAAYNGCKAWIFPSELEGYGLPILEAMSCGTPVIATPAGAAPELIGAGGGVLVPHGAPGAMAVEVVRFSEMGREEWDIYSRAAIRTASEHTWERACERFETELVRMTSAV
jgi:glycosyltransferase involved in cell wall biosynthesis